jgi:hypothetical protein
MRSIERVHVVFKTHLDIGFTDLAHKVVQQYMNHYIPKAIELAEQLAAKKDEPAKFIWTTGSWLIHEYLKQANPEQKRKMEDAIRCRYITWHGLPFTTHTELMDESLFKHGLSLSLRLDKQFGKRTIAAKMTDVPGHTRAIVSLMAQSGIQYLHIGVNPASKVPNVPDLFVWRGKDGSEIIVNYSGNYGNVLELNGLQDVMVFAHTGDNNGPPSLDEINKGMAHLQQIYPGALVQASTMDAFAEKLLPLKNKLPVVFEEIGDSWIHGTTSDPKKTAQYRALLRLRKQWMEQGNLTPDSLEYEDFSDNLMLVAEHTWGMDEKKHLGDYKHYSLGEFTSAREANIVAKHSVLDKYKYIVGFELDEMDTMSRELFTNGRKQTSYQTFESSWQEQREYIVNAVAALSKDKQTEVKQAFLDLEPKRIMEESGDIIIPHIPYRLGCFEVEFDLDGSIRKLVNGKGKVWADEQHPLGVYQYETFGSDNYQTWFEQYIENIDQTYSWADGDFGKPGMELALPKPKHRNFTPNAFSMKVLKGHDMDTASIRLALSESIIKEMGAPEEIVLEWRFFKDEEKIEVTLNWFGKQANRLPEATWFSFSLNVDNPNLWMLDKMGERISPLEVVKNGNRNMHAINSGVYYHGADGVASILSVDAHIVSPGERRLLIFDNNLPPLDGGFHFLLHNNVWGTNFPMWYGEDSKFRFTLSFQAF